MGEMADMALEHLFDIMEADDLGYFTEDEDPENYVGPRRGPLIKTCKFCGKNGLVWGKEKSGKWRLFSKSGELHTCGKKNK